MRDLKMAWHHHDHGNRARRLLLEIRAGLAFLKLKAAMRRVHLASLTKFDPGQPRDDHGRWTTGGGGGVSVTEGGLLVAEPGSDTLVTDETGEESWASVASSFDDEGALTGQVISNRDGSEIRSQFNPPDNTALDERHTVKMPDGTRVSFENSGNTQTIRDATTGEALSAATWTADGAFPEATVQPVLAQAYAAEKTVEAAAYLFVWMSGQNSADQTAVFSFNAREYQPGAEPNQAAIWVGQLTKDQTDAACPRHAEVQERTDYAADVTTREGNTWWSATRYGTAVHKNLEEQINELGDPNFLAEASYLKSQDAGYGVRGSVRIDVLENVRDGTVCVYDIKTGKSGLSAARSAEIASEVHSRFPPTQRIIVIETRPRK